MLNNMVGDVDQLQFLWQRASFPVYKKFGINAAELSFLRALYFSQRLQCRSAVSKETFYRELSGNRNRWRKYEGYRFGLLEKKLIGSFEYISRPGSESLGVSDLGLAVIRAHNEALLQLFEKYPALSEDLTPLGHRFRQTA